MQDKLAIAVRLGSPVKDQLAGWQGRHCVEPGRHRLVQCIVSSGVLKIRGNVAGGGYKIPSAVVAAGSFSDRRAGYRAQARRDLLPNG